MYAGIDAGSRAIKIAIVNDDGEVVCLSEAPQGNPPGTCSDDLYSSVLVRQGLGRADIARCVATGYARAAVMQADATITEISCHAAGVHRLHPQARMIVEIGGQDSKLMRLGEDGLVRDFAMNDRCAAGTGRFLELVAARLGCSLGELSDLAARSTQPAVISSMCAVFAETEIVGLLASGVFVQDIASGVLAAVASRLAAMAAGSVTPPVVFTGGVARVAGMDLALQKTMGCAMLVPPQPQFTGAIGAALLARRDARAPKAGSP